MIACVGAACSLSYELDRCRISSARRALVTSASACKDDSFSHRRREAVPVGEKVPTSARSSDAHGGQTLDIMTTRFGFTLIKYGHRSTCPGAGVKVTVIGSFVVGLSGETAIVPNGDCAYAEPAPQTARKLNSALRKSDLMGPNA